MYCCPGARLSQPDLVAAMGAAALLIEVYPNPAEAWSDGAQQASFTKFAESLQELKPFIRAAEREYPPDH